MHANLKKQKLDRVATYFSFKLLKCRRSARAVRAPISSTPLWGKLAEFIFAKESVYARVRIFEREKSAGIALIRLGAGGFAYPAMVTKPEVFDGALLGCIDDAVKAVLGEQVLESLFVRLETCQHLPREEIPRHVDTFFAGLEQAFGKQSGKTVGRFIIKLLYARLEMKFDSRPDGLLEDYIMNAKRSLAQEC